MSVSTVSRPPLWARNNARQAIELMDGTPAYVSFLKQKPQPGRVIQKRGTEANIRAYLQDMQTQGRVLITGDRDFIAPCLGTIFVSDGGEVERNVLLSKIEFKIQRSGVVTRTTPFMNIPHHAFGRVFERDLRPPVDVARTISSRDFINSVLKLYALSDPEAAANSFAIRFLGGFLTGTVREFATGPEVVETKVLDVRTFLHARDKPEWVRNTQQVPYTLFEYSDRRAQKSSAVKIADMIEDLAKPLIFGPQPSDHKDLPPGA